MNTKTTLQELLLAPLLFQGESSSGKEVMTYKIPLTKKQHTARKKEKAAKEARKINFKKNKAK